MEITEMWFWNS